MAYVKTTLTVYILDEFYEQFLSGLDSSGEYTLYGVCYVFEPVNHQEIYEKFLDKSNPEFSILAEDDTFGFYVLYDDVAEQFYSSDQQLWRFQAEAIMSNLVTAYGKVLQRRRWRFDKKFKLLIEDMENILKDNGNK